MRLYALSLAAAVILYGPSHVPSAAAAAPSADATTKLFTESRLVVRDRFSDEILGSGPDLILIPGLASSREVWKATAERLKGRYRLHLIQVAGFAGEPGRANATGEVVKPTAEAIDAYIAEQNLAPATVIAHSLGATSTLYLLERHPEHYKKALLVDCLPFFGVMIGGLTATSDSVRPIAEKLRDSMATASEASPQYQQQMKGMVTGPADLARIMGWSAASDRHVVAYAMAEDLTLDLRPGLGAVAAPVTVFYPDNVSLGAPKGAMDGFYGAVFAPLPKKTLVRFDDSRHFIMFDQPEKFAAALDAFLAS